MAKNTKQRNIIIAKILKRVTKTFIQNLVKFCINTFIKLFNNEINSKSFKK